MRVKIWEKVFETTLRILLVLLLLYSEKSQVERQNFFYGYLLHLLDFSLREVEFYGNKHVCE